MAAQIIKMGGRYNTNLYELVVDSVDEISMLPTATSYGTGDFSNMSHCMPMGSTCIVKGGSKYELFSDGWSEVTSDSSATVNISAETGNIISEKSDGIYADISDIETRIDTLESDVITDTDIDNMFA